MKLTSLVVSVVLVSMGIMMSNSSYSQSKFPNPSSERKIEYCISPSKKLDIKKGAKSKLDNLYNTNRCSLYEGKKRKNRFIEEIKGSRVTEPSDALK